MGGILPDTEDERAVRKGVEAGRTDAQIAETMGLLPKEVGAIRRRLKLQAQRAKKPDAADARLELRIPPDELATLDAHVVRTGQRSRAGAIRAWIRSLR